MIPTLARALALAWASWWTLFGLLAGIGEGYGLSGILLHVAFPGLAFLAAAVTACHRQAVGGALLVAVGLSTQFMFPFSHGAEGWLTLTLPPLVSGAILLARAWSARLRRSGPAG